MKHLQIYEGWFNRIQTKEDILNFINKYSTQSFSNPKFTINKDMSVDVSDNIFFTDFRKTKMPIKFNRIDGGFYLRGYDKPYKKIILGIYKSRIKKYLETLENFPNLLAK